MKAPPRFAPLTWAIALCLATNNLYAETTEDKPLDTIEVTARKKVESMQSVPMGVVAVTDAQLQERGIDDVQELSHYVAGLEQPRLAIQSRLSLRGVSSGDNQSFEQAVGTYVDSVYRGRMNQHRSGFFDMARVEVLKGPQVTLYGNSSIGGAISMITHRPEFEYSGYVSAAYEFEYGEQLIHGAVNLPVSDQFAVRLAAKFREDDGIAPNAFTGNDEPRADEDVFRISALYQGDKTRVFLRHEQGDFAVNGYPMDVFKHVDAQGQPWPGSIYTGLNDGQLDVGNNAHFNTLATFWTNDTDETMLEIEHQWGDITLTSVTAFSDYDFVQSYDSDWTSLSMINSELYESYEQFSQELRIAGEAGQNTDYMLGLYYQKDDLDSLFYADFNMPLLLSVLFPGTLEGFSGLVSPFSRPLQLKQETKQWALLGNVSHNFSDKLTGSLAFRYVDIDKTADQFQGTADINHTPGLGGLVDTRWLADFSLQLNPAYLADPMGYIHDALGLEQAIPAPDYAFSYGILSGGLGFLHDFKDLKRDESHAMFNLSFQYQLTDASMLYGSWANGAKAGGFDLYYEGYNPAEAEYQDEEARVFELGLKNDWANLRLNAALFYGKYENLQVGIFNGGIGLVVTNAPSSVSRGLDVELTWRINDNLTLYGNVEYLDFYYDHFPKANCSRTDAMVTGNTFCDWTGDPTPFVPRQKGSLTLEHYYPLSSSYELRNWLTYSYKGKHTTASDNEVQTMQSAYALVDYRLDVINLDSDWKVGMAVRNLFDKTYTSYTTIIPLSVGGAFAHQLEKGRQVALEFSYEF